MLQINKDICYNCGQRATEKHHCLFGSRKKKCDELDLVVYLCHHCHRGTKGVHGMYGKELKERLQQLAQTKFEEEDTREEFIKAFGRNYL